jgi:chromosome segregation ATPase
MKVTCAVAFLLFVCVICVSSGQPQDKLVSLEKAARRFEKERDEIRDSSEERIAALRMEQIQLQASLDRAQDALSQAKEELEHEVIERRAAVTTSDSLQRELTDARRTLQESATRENTVTIALSQCETKRSEVEMEVMRLKRSNDLLQSEVRQLHARDETMMNLQKDHEKRKRRWREIESSHQRQVDAFHHDDIGVANLAEMEADPNPEVGTPHYFSQLKAEEEAYRAEVHRRKEAEL